MRSQMPLSAFAILAALAWGSAADESSDATAWSNSAAPSSVRVQSAHAEPSNWGFPVSYASSQQASKSGQSITASRSSEQAVAAPVRTAHHREAKHPAPSRKTSLLALGSRARSSARASGYAQPAELDEQLTQEEAKASQSDDSTDSLSSSELAAGSEMAEVAKSVEEVAGLAQTSMAQEEKMQHELDEVKSESKTAAEAIGQTRSTIQALQEELKQLAEAQDLTQKTVESLTEALKKSQAEQAELSNKLEQAQAQAATAGQRAQSAEATAHAAQSLTEARAGQVQSVLNSVAKVAQTLSAAPQKEAQPPQQQAQFVQTMPSQFMPGMPVPQQQYYATPSLAGFFR